ncbi:hypothetical protein [Defluviimonas sp. SAOS-178_SWC]|uniref:hypothetical protein n=1 Tax=Defluviimonas sp. SAOS-178_SWC TaxID=3121287 RepID=UPI0032217E26
MLHPIRPVASETDARWTTEPDRDARHEASDRRAELASFVSGGILIGAHPDYLSILDADDPRILAADWPPLMPSLLRAARRLARRALTAMLHWHPMKHPNVGSEMDAQHAGGQATDPARGLHA